MRTSHLELLRHVHRHIATTKAVADSRMNRKWEGSKLVFKGTSQRRCQGRLRSHPFGGTESTTMSAGHATGAASNWPYKQLAAQAQVQEERRRRERPSARKLGHPEPGEFVRQGPARPQSRPDRGSLAARPTGRAREVVVSEIDLRLDQNKRTPPPLGIVPVAACPRIIDRRERLGDVEGNTVLGSPGTGGPTTFAVRASRFTLSRGSKPKSPTTSNGM